MKAITLWQPWASLLACGAKKYETRSWATSYRGPIAIHAALKTGYPMELYFGDQSNFWTQAGDALLPKWETFQQIFDCAKVLPRGAIIATADLVGCWKAFDPALIGEPGNFPCIDQPNQWKKIFGNELIFGDFTPGRYAWEFANMTLLPEPIPAKGKQRLWEWEANTDG